MTIGNVETPNRGSGARFNDGKPDLALLPMGLLSVSHEVIPADINGLLTTLEQWQFREKPLSLDHIARQFPFSVRGTAGVFEYGKHKYAAWNWAKGMPWSVPLGCIGRHALAMLEGQECDPESGLPHRDHIWCNLVMLDFYTRHYPEGDDRPFLPKDLPACKPDADR